MERKRSQYQRLKQQQQQRFCVSQQDLTEALTRMKSTENHFEEESREILKASSSSSSAIERLDTRTVSKLVKEFEARAIINSYGSTQNLLPLDNNLASNRAEFNSSHMFARTMKFKDDDNDNSIINNNVCSLISSSIVNDNQMAKVEIQREKNIVDKEQEKNDEQIYETLDADLHRVDLRSTSPLYTTIDKHYNSPIEMVTRSTNIDEAAKALRKQHHISFDELLVKEARLNHALADLLSISNDNDKSLSINASPKPIINKNQRRRTFSTKNDNNNISATVDLLNNLLEQFDLDKVDSNKNKIEYTKSLHNQKNDDKHIKPINIFCLMLSDNVCANCHQSFANNEQIVNAAGQIWHTNCFVCTQCFQPFENGLYFEHEDRKYCERDFQMLFAPCCAECKQPIVGRVIRALQKCFHPDCFRCQLCQTPLVEIGFLKYNGRALCRDCHGKEKLKDMHLIKQTCSTCHKIIDNKCLKYKGEFHHAYHFTCTSCQTELDENSREIRGSLYCLPCHQKLDIPVCAACRRVIDDRVISALGKQWHVEHFCCARCAQPFYGSKHFENKGLAYCESDYHFLFGSTCFICNGTITEGAYTACNKKYCADHFTCSICEKKMNEKSKFFDVDAVPVCKPCYGKLPSITRKSLQQTKKKPISSTLKQTSV